MELASNLGFAIVDRMLGGGGESFGKVQRVYRDRADHIREDHGGLYRIAGGSMAECNGTSAETGDELRRIRSLHSLFLRVR